MTISIATCFPKEGGAALAPYLLGFGVCVGCCEQGSGKLLDRQRVRAARGNELAQLPDLAGAQLLGFVVERLQFRIKVAGFAHRSVLN
jgi:hypothetical protein